MDDLPTLKADSFHIATSNFSCWDCKKDSEVYAIFVKNLYDIAEESELEEAVSLTYIASLNSEVDQLLQTLTNGRFSLDYSFNADEQYYMNHCQHCSAKIGDFYLFKSGNVFSPSTLEDYQKLKLVFYNLPIFTDSGYNMGTAVNVFDVKGL